MPLSPWPQDGIPTLSLTFIGGWFAVPPVVFPGQAIDTTWNFSASYDVGTSLGLKVYLGSDLLFTPNPVPFTGDTGTQSLSIPPPTDPTLAKTLYTPGQKTLRLDVTGNGTSPGPYHLPALLSTKLETLDDTWWGWGSSPSTANWKDDYAIVGSLTDKGHAALSGGTITLLESEIGSAGPGPSLARGTVTLPALNAGATSGLLSFPVINQDWQWFSPLLMLVIGPFAKTFVYSVVVSVQDQFANSYPATLGTQAVTVSPSTDKLLAASGAMSAAETALIFAIAAALAAAGVVTAWDAPLLLAIAAGFYAAAQVFAAAANDPPEADPRFRERVIPAPVEFPMIEIRSDLSATVKALLEGCAGVIADHMALNETVGRLIGARQAGDQEGVDIQLASYHEIQQEAAASGRDIPALVERAVRAVAESGQLESGPLRRAMTEWRDSGVPGDLQSAWEEAGLPPVTLNALDAINRHADWAAAFTSIENTLSHLGEAVSRLAALDAETSPDS